MTGPDPATSPADPLPILDGKGAPITGDTIATLAAKLAKNKDTLGPSVAVVVSDTFTGDPITAVNADTPIVAASVQNPHRPCCHGRPRPELPHLHHRRPSREQHLVLSRRWRHDARRQHW